MGSISDVHLVVPPLSCDSHLHVFDEISCKRPEVEDPPRPWGSGEYQALQSRLGLQRAVVVTPALYGTDNQSTLTAIEQLGKANTRGVAVVYPDVSDAELEVLHAGGIRGIRFSLFNPKRAATTPDMIEPLAHRVQRLGWHIQLHLMPEQIVEHRALLERLPVPLVFDHMLRLGPLQAITHDAVDLVADWVGRERCWIKLSGAYLNSKTHGHHDTVALAKALVELAPHRTVWGSDWPHPTEQTYDPDDRALLSLMTQWVPDDAQRYRIFVDNPAELYGF